VSDLINIIFRNCKFRYKIYLRKHVNIEELTTVRIIPPRTTHRLLNYLAFKYFDFERTWWSNSRNASCALNLISTLFSRSFGQYLCLWTSSSWGYHSHSSQFFDIALKKNAPSGGRRENVWGISCEKSRFYAKKILFFPILGGRAPGAAPPIYNEYVISHILFTV
jgi:hypothetical protein